MNLYEAQWLACVLPYRRFAAVLTDGHARLGADVDRYSVITSDLHRLLVAGLLAHCERHYQKEPIGAITSYSEHKKVYRLIAAACPSTLWRCPY